MASSMSTPRTPSRARIVLAGALLATASTGLWLAGVPSGCSSGGGSGSGDPAPDDGGNDDDPARMTMLLAAQKAVAPLHKPKSRPGPGDWLAQHAEDGQTFAQYRAANPNRPDGRRTTIYLLPMGWFGEEQTRLLAASEELLGVHFGLPVKRLPRIDTAKVPAHARRENSFGTQFLTDWVLDEAFTRVPEDAVAVLVLTARDLWPGRGWNFVFGQASLDRRVGVWSTARFGDPKLDYQRVLDRTLGTAVHETGHMFGILHCTAHECGMNGSNNLAEADRTPLWWCPQCEAKVWWACKVDPKERYARLAAFAAKHGLKEAEAHWLASGKAVEGAGK